MSNSLQHQTSVETLEIDESLYSRQLYVMGEEAMRQLVNPHVLISGMQGLGVEIAKNIILGGVKSVLIHDSGKVDYKDLSSQYYFSSFDIGQNRAEVANKKLSELNNYVHLKYSSETINERFLEKNQVNVFILTNANFNDQIKLNEYCHQHGIKFINANTKGLFGQIFCDFGQNFQVLDTNGENPLTQIVMEISHDEIGIVSMSTDKRYGFEDGSYVTFHGVKGMTEVNDREFKISVSGPYTLIIGDTRNFGIYEGGGTVTQVKKTEILYFKSFSEALLDREMVICDFCNMSMSANLHLAFQSLSQFEKEYNALPKPWNESDAEKFYELVEKLNFQTKDKPFTDELNKNSIKLFSKICQGDLCPMQSVIGGIAAQEAMKAVTGKFMPIRQFFYFDAIQCLPENVFQTSSSNEIIIPKLPTNNSRYYSQEIVFGEDLQEKISKSKYFLVGAGAIGCEILKNFSMMGIGSDKDGGVYLTDRNSIKKSNLNQQFLFRSSNIGNMKSKIAAAAVKRMNPEINIHAFVDEVSQETEHIYDDKFFQRLDGVVSALDNIKARQYIDHRCVYYRKTLVDSGILGTKANLQVVVPFLTESYSSINDSHDLLTPLDVVCNFPNLSEHTIHWARDNFANLFTIPAQQAEEFLLHPQEFAKRLEKNHSEYEKKKIIENVKRMFGSEHPKKFLDCIKWSRNLFEQQFHNRISLLLYHYPRDYICLSGERFWKGHRRCPHRLHFDINNKNHLDFIVAASNLLAHMYFISHTRDRQGIAEEVSKIRVEEFQPESYIATLKNEEQLIENEDSYINEILNRLPKYDEIRHIKIQAHVFEKDDDTNFHLDYITATANLRAENYEIETTDRSNIKRIAGNIIPVIVTTTAMISGLVSLQVYKFIQDHKNIESYKDAFVNLALPFFAFFQPQPAKQQKYLNCHFTLWDRFEINNDMTLEELLQYFKREHQLVPTMLSVGEMSLIYNRQFMHQTNTLEYMKRKISEIYERVTETKIPAHVRSLILHMVCNDLEGNNVEVVPYIKYTFR